MAISSDIIQKLLRLLRPLMQSESQRRGYLIRSLGMDTPVLNRLLFNQPVDNFITDLLRELVALSETTAGKPALCALLEVIREDVGTDVKVSIDELLQEIREQLQRSPLYPRPEFQTYLENIAQDKKYQQWSNFYTLTDAEGKVFDVRLMVQTWQPKQREGIPGEGKQETERLPVLEGIRKSLEKVNHVLLIGKPGSGKSTALQRLLWEEARKALENPQHKIPVLVPLKDYIPSLDKEVSGVIYLIKSFLENHELWLEVDDIKRFLLEKRFLLLVDGLNELPTELSTNPAYKDLKAFRQRNSRVPMILTTRDLGRDSLGIETQLEMQPLTKPQIEEFVRAYLGNNAEEMLRRLNDRKRKFAETPLLLWMLCRVYAKEAKIPENLGSAFQEFTSIYDNNLKADVPVYENSRSWWSELLQQLAFNIIAIEGFIPTLNIRKSKAEDILTQFLEREKFDKPRDYAKRWLEDLLEHHLIQYTNNNKIEFRHQLLQEYYAAEYLLRLLEQNRLSDAKLKRDYLNYLKWTESIAIALTLVEDEALALRVVQLALGVDLMLGARLAGEVKEEFQEKTVGLVFGLEVHQRLKIELLGMTRSEQARSPLQQAQDNRDYDNVYSLAEALSCVGDDQLMSQLLEWEDKHIAELNQAAFDEDYHNYFLCERIASELENIESSDVVVLNLVKLLNDKNLINKKGSDEYFKPRNYQAQAVLGEGLFNQAISFLLKSLKHEDFRVRYHAALALGNIGSDAEACALFKIVEDENYFVRSCVVEALGRFRSYTVITPLIKALNDEKAFVRSRAAEAVGKFRDDKVINALIQALKDENYFVRSNVVKALGKMHHKQVLEHLIKALNDENSDVRWSAVIALGKLAKLNPRNKLIIDALISALNDEESSISSSATDVLEEINKNRLIDSVLDKESLVSSYPVQVEEIVESKFLPQMQELLLVAIYEMKDLILKIQENYKFYNHKIFHSPPIEQTKSTSTSSTTIINSEIVQIIEKNEGDVIGKKITET